MIQELETLEALARLKTMTKTATALRVTQSTVSKRIANLEFYSGKKLIQKDGRKVSITHEGNKILKKALPHLNGLKDAIFEESIHISPRVQIGFSESILSSWGAKALSRLQKEDQNFHIIPHAHRGPVIIDRVRSGELSFGVCAGYCSKAPDLEVQEIGRESFVLISSKNGPLNRPLMSIESSSETWPSIENQCKKQKIFPTERLESFSSILQLAQVGLVDALVPVGIAKYTRLNKVNITETQIKRPIIMIGRKSAFMNSNLDILSERLKKKLINELSQL